MAEAITGYARAELLFHAARRHASSRQSFEVRGIKGKMDIGRKGIFLRDAGKEKDGSIAWVEISADPGTGRQLVVQEIWRVLFERRTFASALRDSAEGLEKKGEDPTAELNKALSKRWRSIKTELEKAYAKLKDSGEGSRGEREARVLWEKGHGRRT